MTTTALLTRVDYCFVFFQSEVTAKGKDEALSEVRHGCWQQALLYLTPAICS